jgi:sugar/nucleoside kinase (ribokinase family)
MITYDAVGIDMPCIDLNLVMQNFPRPGGGESVRQLSWQGGGKVASGMVACARLGIKCAMMGCAGDDAFGRFIINDFIRHGISVESFKVHKNDTSSLSVVLSDRETSNRTFIFRMGTSPRYTEMDINAGLIRQAKYLFICSGDPVVEYAADIAREAGVQVFIDADGYSQTILGLIPKIDVFVGSENFYTQMFGNDDYEKNCRSIMKRGPHTVLFTLGENGCVGVSEEGFFKLPAFQIEVADTVGAGDVFHGGFLAGLLDNRTVEDAARFANAVAAIKCTRIGGRAGIPDKTTVERFLRDGFIDYTEIDERVKFYERGLEHV